MELQSWLDHRVFDLVKKKFVDQERIMRARWVLTWKSCGKAKARLCELVFQDPDLTEVSRESPTMSAASEALITQWVVSHKYRLISGDIKTAFLVRNVFISPPGDVRQMLNVDHETVFAVEEGGVWIGKGAEEVVGQTQEIVHPTWFHKLCSRSMCICSSNEWANPWSAGCACR